MGLSIHYNGKFNPKTSLKEMIEEVKDIAEIYKWKFHIFDEIFPENSFGKEEYNQSVYGIMFTPPECESVHLTFLSNGRMSSVSHLQFYGNSKDETEKKYLYMLSTKTQYAGIEIHKLIIHLFKYLTKKYMTEFTMMDEGNYWETGDEIELQKIFDRYNLLMDNFTKSLENNPKKSTESFETYFERLLNQIRKKDL